MPAAKSCRQYQTILDEAEDIAVQRVGLKLAAQNVLHDKLGRPIKPVRGRVSNYALARFALLRLSNGGEASENASNPSLQNSLRNETP